MRVWAWSDSREAPELRGLAWLWPGEPAAACRWSERKVVCDCLLTIMQPSPPDPKASREDGLNTLALLRVKCAGPNFGKRTEMIAVVKTRHASEIPFMTMNADYGAILHDVRLMSSMSSRFFLFFFFLQYYLV